MRQTLRVLLVAPHRLDEPRGNSVTLERLATGLRQVGVGVRLLGPDEPDPQQRFDIVHAFHAYKAGPRGLALAKRRAAPLVVTFTGTDVHQDLARRGRRRVLARVLNAARALIVYQSGTLRRLRGYAPAWGAKARVIPAAAGPEFFACGWFDFRSPRRARVEAARADG